MWLDKTLTLVQVLVALPVYLSTWGAERQAGGMAKVALQQQQTVIQRLRATRTL
jgi:hypothetical protein